MRIIKPKFEIWEQEEGIEGIYRQIEKAGRVCYASDPIEGKAKDFVDRMIRLGHGAMLEHGTVYLGLPPIYPIALYKYRDNKYSNYKEIRLSDVNSPKVYAYVSTNYRVLIQGDYNTWDEALANNFDKNWLDDLQYLCEPTEHHIERVTIHFTTQIAITREFNRHRVNSMAEQSTRYCDYSGNNEKFEGVGINLPSWVDSEIQRLEDITENVLPTFGQLKEEYFSVSDQGITKDDWGDIEWWLWSSLVAEESYQNLRKLGRKPQEARVVLPLDTNTELVHTAFISDWEHFFKLRCDKTAHPDARILAEPLQEEFYNKNILK